MNPFKIIEPTCISFSGGRTSAYMLYKVLEAHDMSLPEDAIVCFANTGKEDEATLKFVHDCETHWGIKIHWLEYRPEDPKVTRVNFETASRNGEPFEALIKHRRMLPNVRARFCTVELKMRTMARYLKTLGIDEYDNFIGIRADEPRRVARMRPDNSRENTLMPLAASSVCKQDVLEFWKNQPFDLGLPVIGGETIGGNCDLCFLKSTSKILTLIKQNPQRSVWWASMEEYASTVANTNGSVFRIDRPKYAHLSKFVDQQGDLFDDSIECFCGD